MTTRRKYSNTHKTTIIKKISSPAPCVSCTDLKYTPSFTESIMSVHKLSAAQVPAWYHQRGHSVFPK